MTKSDCESGYILKWQFDDEVHIFMSYYLVII
jgi:hypothetical protein